MITTIFSAATAASLLFTQVPGSAVQHSTLKASATSASEDGTIERGAYTDIRGFEIDYAIWRDEGNIGGDVSVYDPRTGDRVDMWIDGDMIRFEGLTDRAAFSGVESATELFITPDAPKCVGWLAVVCAGIGVLAGGCAFGWTACTDSSETDVPGGQGGDPGGSGGGGGDGGSSEGPDEGGGGDGED